MSTSDWLPCNAYGIPHDKHKWDFGSGETFLCPGFICPTCDGRGVWMDEECHDCAATPHAPSQPSHPETTAAGGTQD